MKGKIGKIIMIVATLVISISYAGLSSYSNATDTSFDFFNYKFSSPIITTVKINDKTFSSVEIENCLSIGEEGQPSLPHFTVTLALPLDKKVSSIEVVPYLKKTININNNIVPQQKYITLSNESKQEFVYDSEIYNTNKNIKDDLFVIQDIQYYCGYPVLTIILYPINYNPVQNKLSFYDSFDIKINYKGEDKISKNYRNLECDKEYVQSFVDNPSDVQNIPINYVTEYTGGICDPAKKYDYVIITNATLNDTTGEDYNLTSLLNYRTIHNGFNCTKISTSDIMNCSDYWNSTALFNDTEARIREFCKDAYQDWNTKYILIVGDWDSNNEVVPARMFVDRHETEPINDMPCDLYFSNLDGNWYDSTNSLWGGGKGSGAEDLTSELYVGRIAAYNASMISNTVNKTIWYENTSHSVSWQNNCTFGGANLGWTVTSKRYMEQLRIGNGWYSENVGFDEWNNLSNDYTLNTTGNRYYDEDGQWNGFQVSIANDNSSIINQLGHSDWTNPFTIDTWETFSNTKPFFGYSQGCLAGRFISGYSGCEELICRHPREYAFALELNTGYGWGESIDSDGPSQQLNKLFWDYFFNASANDMNSWQIGKAHAYSKDKMSELISSTDRVWENVWYSNNLFGDPALTLQFKNVLAQNQTIILSINGDANMTTISTPTPTFKWTTITNASQYWLQISSDKSFITIIVNLTNINSVEYPLNCIDNGANITFTLPVANELLTFGVLYIRVCAYVGATIR